jgi:hypothetical protein
MDDPRAVAAKAATMRVAALRPAWNPAQVVDWVLLWHCPASAPDAPGATTAAAGWAE